MKTIEKSKNQLIFSAEIEESLANSIRRYVNQIPIAAIDELEISRNDSPLYDEAIAHRAGLIPLKAEKGAEKDKLKLSVKREGIVYSGDLKGKPGVVYDNIPITMLNKGQELEFTATIKIGKASEHSKFSPGIMFYRNSTEILMDKELIEDVRRVLPDVEIKEKGNKILIEDNGKKEITDLCEGIYNKGRKKIEINNGKELIITLESFGQISPESIFKDSIEALKKDLASIGKAINKA